MISKFDLKEYLKKNSDKYPYIYNESEDAIYDKDGTYLTSMDDFLALYRKKSGESFESIFYDHIALRNVLRCTECGTVVFSTEDEWYDPHLKCPVCTEYKPHFTYWTKEEIEDDAEKKNTLAWFDEEMTRRAEVDARYKKRGGKYDWQIGSKKFYGKKRYLGLELECDDITKSYFKGLRLDICIGKKESDDDISYIRTKSFTVPLSWSHFYIMFVYPHLGKCHPDFRSKWYIGKRWEDIHQKNNEE